MYQYLGEIRLFAGDVAPSGWAFCNGQAMSMTEYPALYTVLTTKYGGDGIKTFNLPDLRGRIPVHIGQGPGVDSYYRLGQTFGEETVPLTTQQIPPHSHSFEVAATTADATAPAGAMLAEAPVQSGFTGLYTDTPLQPGTTGALAPQAIGSTGGGQAHPNMMPSTAINYIIAITGSIATAATS